MGLPRMAGVTAVIALLASPAAADESSEPVRVSPGSVIMDKTEPYSMVSLDYALTFFDGDASGDLFGNVVMLHGQYLAPVGVGGYLTIPLSFGIATSDVLDDETDFGFGNIELGGLYSRDLGFGAHLVARAGIGLPTARDNTMAGSLAYVSGLFADLSNLQLLQPETTTVRVGGSLIGIYGQYFYRVDVGVDVPVSSPGDGPEPLIRMNASAGVSLPSLSAGLEFITAGSTIDEEDISPDERFVHNLAAFARYHVGTRLSPVVAIGFPIDDETRGLIDLFVYAGVDVPLEL